MNFLKFLSLTLAVGSALFPSAARAQNSPAAAPAAEVHLPLDTLNGVVVLDAIYTGRFDEHGVSNKMSQPVVVDGPAFLKQHEGRVRAVVKPYLSKPFSQDQLKLMQQALILLCRELDHPWVDVYYPPQKIVNNVVQIVVYEGFLGKVTAVYSGRRWFSEKFITNSIHLRHGDSISQKRLIKDVNRINVEDPQFLEVNVDVKQGVFDEDRTGNTDIDVLVKDRFPLRVFVGYDDYGVRELGENRVFSGFDYGNVWGIAHQFHYQYTTDLDFDHLRSHTASYVAPFSWGHSLTLFGGYSDLNAALPTSFQSTGRAYQISVRYTMPIPTIAIPQWGNLDQDISLGYDFKFANTPLLFNYAPVNGFRAAIDQFVASYHARLPDEFGYTDIQANGFYSPGSMLGPNTTADFRTFARSDNQNLTANYYYGRFIGERVIAGKFLPWHSFLDLKGGYQVSSERLLPSEEWYLGGDQVLRGYAENVVAGSEGYNATAEWHLPIMPNWRWVGTNQLNITHQRSTPGINGDTMDFYGFYDYGSVRPSGEESPRYYLQSAGAGLRMTISGNLEVRFAYGFGLRALPAQNYGPTPLLDSHRRGALLSATLSF